MGNATAVSVIAAMITPALLILASASLVASALVRMARIVDRTRALAAGTQDAAPPALLRAWLDRHAARARCAELSIGFLYAAIVVFTATCLSIALDRFTGGALPWLPVALALGGTLLLLAGGTWMVAESRLSWAQIREEITDARRRLEEKT